MDGDPISQGVGTIETTKQDPQLSLWHYITLMTGLRVLYRSGIYADMFLHL
ncbi:hypothetical protein [Pareuzebyella sediminis]|uniref:hypothetical protein n=1 Tax=Pareuzebyella sediminis TaxID=2607998 RepID=UPI0018E190CA|nr:hypothetical protein [Pareuzebyella sediminis]